MSNVVKGAMRWLNRTIKGETLEKEANLSYITLVGILGEIVSGLPKNWENLSDKTEELDRSLMFLGTRFDPLMHEYLTRLLENIEIYKKAVKTKDELSSRLTSLEEELKNAEGDEKTYLEFDVFQIDKRLESAKETVDIYQTRLAEDAKIVVSKTIPKVDPRTLVLDKPMPIIIDSGYSGPRLEKRKLVE